MSHAIERSSYLRRVLGEHRVLESAAELGDLAVPDWWRAALTCDGAARTSLVIERWRADAPALPRTIEALEERLRRVVLLVARGEPWLLYELNVDGDVAYYGGGDPGRRTPGSRVAAQWSRLPEPFLRFYERLHDGWSYLASESLGPARSGKFFFLDEEEWGGLEFRHGDPPDPCHLLAVFTNGIGDFVALDVNDGSGVLWWKEEPPTVGLDVWAVLDAWTVLGIESD